MIQSCQLCDGNGSSTVWLVKTLTGIPQRLFVENLWDPVELKQSVEYRLAEQKLRVSVFAIMEGFFPFIGSLV